MAVRNRDEIITAFNTVIGENPSDEAIQLLEDVSDTIDNARNDNDTEDWHQKFLDNDKMWRKRYVDRFSGKGADDVDTGEDEEEEEPSLTFEALFTK